MFTCASDYFIEQLISKVIQSWVSYINKDYNTGYNYRFTIFKYVSFLLEAPSESKVTFNFLRATTAYKFPSSIYSKIISSNQSITKACT